MVTREQLTYERVEKLLQMIEDNGATASGELPRKEDLKALRQTRDLGQAEKVRENFRNGNSNSPPPFE